MNNELQEWAESLSKKASDNESCMICTKQIDFLGEENARLQACKYTRHEEKFN